MAATSLRRFTRLSALCPVILVILLSACVQPTPTPTLNVNVDELACVDLFPGVQPPPGSPTHMLTAAGSVVVTVRDVDLTVEISLDVIDANGNRLGQEAVGLPSPLLIPADDSHVPFTISWGDAPQAEGASCRVTVVGGTGWFAPGTPVTTATAPIDVIYAP